MSATVERLPRNIRFPADDLAEIDRRARAHGLDRTRFLIDSALERLPSTKTTEQRFQGLEERLERLEASLFGDE